MLLDEVKREMWGLNKDGGLNFVLFFVSDFCGGELKNTTHANLCVTGQMLIQLTECGL